MKSRYKFFYVLIGLLLFAVGCAEPKPNNQLFIEVSGNDYAEQLSFYVYDLERPGSKPAKYFYGILNRDLQNVPVNIAVNKPESGFAGEVWLCALGVSNNTVVMSDSFKTQLPYDQPVVITMSMDKNRFDKDGDCFAQNDTNDPSMSDCNDNNSAINPLAIEDLDGIDNNCDGNIDEGLKECSCTEGQQRECTVNNLKGLCRKGKKSCHNCEWGECVSTVDPVEENCYDDLDNDCDGETDEGCELCTPGDTIFCWEGKVSKNIKELTFLDNNNVRRFAKGLDTPVCRAGTKTCQQDGRWSPCQNALGINQKSPNQLVKNKSKEYQCGYDVVNCDGNTEADCVYLCCDGLDNDCDGETDEDYEFDKDGDGYNICGSRDPNGQLVTDPVQRKRYIECDDSKNYINPDPNVIDLCYESNIDRNCNGIPENQCNSVTCNILEYIVKDNKCYKNYSNQSVNLCDLSTGLCLSGDNVCRGTIKKDEILRAECQQIKDQTCTGRQAPVFENVNDKTDPYKDCANIQYDCKKYFYGWEGNVCYQMENPDEFVKCVSGKCMDETQYCEQTVNKSITAQCGDAKCTKSENCVRGQTISEQKDANDFCVTNEKSSDCSGRFYCNENSECVTSLGADCDSLDNKCSEGQFCVDGNCCESECSEICAKCVGGKCVMDEHDISCVLYYNIANGAKGTCLGGRCKCEAKGVCNGGILGSKCRSDKDCNGLQCGCGDATCSDKNRICVENPPICKYTILEFDGLKQQLEQKHYDLVNNTKYFGCQGSSYCSDGKCISDNCNNNQDCADTFPDKPYCRCGDATCSTGVCTSDNDLTCKYINNGNQVNVNDMSITDSSSSELIWRLNCRYSCKSGICVGNYCTADSDCQGGVCLKHNNFENAQSEGHCVVDSRECEISADGVEDCKIINGFECNDDSECKSGHCVCVSADCHNRKCMAAACSPCQFASALDPDTIMPFCDGQIQAKSQGLCPEYKRCDAHGVCRLVDGQSCTTDKADECLSGNCRRVNSKYVCTEN